MFRHLCSTDKIGVAVELFVDMSKKGNPVTEGVKMNNQTFCTLISGLCTAGQLELAIDLFNKAMANGLIPDVVTYTTIIKGLCEASHEMKAREMIIRMEKEKCPPDDLTFNVMVCGFLRRRNPSKQYNLPLK
ncbi:hypothetical protein QJS10_CPB15g01962 [Acorus calamus]|uniref:Pentatricopeptide repeat-containing protein n=1 Tax=Acorus calamus TaxID=4465 RepID=A0AAV9D4Z1_ACOCL|nr:hypothetical protein QJS10_CPB15g01962 [Acorus calamus]